MVARNEAETVKLRELERRSNVNGVPGVQWLTGAELRELEPDVAGVAALLSPTTAIVDYPAIARSFAADVTAAGGQVLTSTPVTALRLRGADGADGVEADTPAGSFRLSRLVICAGLQADLLAATVGRQPPRPRSSRSGASTCGCARTRPAGCGGSSTRCPTRGTRSSACT